MTREPAVVTVELLKKTHADLYSKFLGAGYPISEDAGEINPALAAGVQDLVKSLEEVAPKIRLLDDYKWIINATSQWQAFAPLLHIPLTGKIPSAPGKPVGPHRTACGGRH